MKQIFFFFILSLGFNLTTHTFAQTTLAVGDIAFNGHNSHTGVGLANDFSFVILRSGGISGGTIQLTDNGRNPLKGPLHNGEGIWSWTATTALPEFTHFI